MQVCVVTFAALVCVACGNFFSSLHTNYVVNLDFESKNLGGAKTALHESESDTHVMSFAGGKQKFGCQLPTSRRGSGDVAKSGSRPSPEMANKLKAHIREAKLASLKGKCWTTKRDYWTYDVCFGRKIVQYRPDSDMRFSLGEFDPESHNLTNDGEVHEQYVGGTDNRSSELHYTCGSFTSRNLTIHEERPMKYSIVINGPSFCPWRDKQGTEAQDAIGNKLKVSSLLEELRMQCLNLTNGWWTYEYCFPHTMRQFHLQQNGKRDPIHTLGTINGTDVPQGHDQVDMTMVRLKPSVTNGDRRSPPSSHLTLKQYLGHGTVCDETKRARTTTMHFQCPANWQSKPETRIVSINEPSLCDYEVLVQTPLLCGHQRLIPALPKGKEVIQCVAESSA